MAAIITSINPTTRPKDSAAQLLTVTGSGFVQAQTPVVFYDGYTIPTTFVSTTQLTATIPAAAMEIEGTYLVWVEQNGATDVSNDLPFIVGPAGAISTITVTAIAPTTRPKDSADQLITVDGTGFNAGLNPVVIFDGNVLATTFVSATQLTAILPTVRMGIEGTYLVWVHQNGGADVSNDLPFVVGPGATVPAPTIISISPATASIGVATGAITVNGTNLNNAPVVVTVNGVVVVPISIAAGQIVLPSSTFATSGNKIVSITTPGGTVSTVISVAANVSAAPTITNRSPISVQVNAATGPITLSGTNLANAPVTVTVDGVAVVPAAISATEIVLPSQTFATTGVKTIVVTTPDGSANTSITIAAAPVVSTQGRIERKTFFDKGKVSARCYVGAAIPTLFILIDPPNSTPLVWSVQSGAGTFSATVNGQFIPPAFETTSVIRVTDGVNTWTYTVYTVEVLAIVPDYSTECSRDPFLLRSTASDGTPSSRVKGVPRISYKWSFSRREVAEYRTVEASWNQNIGRKPVFVYDPVLGSCDVPRLETDGSVQEFTGKLTRTYESFDSVSFSFETSEVW
jgi:hypothetical protein